MQQQDRVRTMTCQSDLGAISWLQLQEVWFPRSIMRSHFVSRMSNAILIDSDCAYSSCYRYHAYQILVAHGSSATEEQPPIERRPNCHPFPEMKHPCVTADTAVLSLIARHSANDRKLTVSMNHKWKGTPTSMEPTGEGPENVDRSALQISVMVSLVEQGSLLSAVGITICHIH